MKYFLPTHCDAGNRGCEAITKSTAILLSATKDNFFVLSKDCNLDKHFNIDQYSTIVPINNISSIDWKIIKLQRLFLRILKLKKRHLVYSCQYDKFLKQISSDDICLSTGGDMFCYEDNEAVYTSAFAQKHKVKTVLWGGSIGKQNLSPSKILALKKFDLIYVRESLSKKDLEEVGLSNVCLYPDPAFILEPEKIDLPSFMIEHECIGLNISNFVVGGFSIDTPFAKEIIKLIEYIISHTYLHIVLFPHVFWADQDDRILSKIIVERFKDSNRIHYFDSEKYGYCQIRYAISKCRFFIGARTHSVISAYSTCVPTIAIGYSIKAKGIAHDIGLNNKLVVDSNTTNKNVLLDSLQYMMENESNIRHTLTEIMPQYINKVYEIKKVISKI